MVSRRILGSGTARNLFSHSRSVLELAGVKPYRGWLSLSAADSGRRTKTLSRTANKARGITRLLCMGGLQQKIVYERARQQANGATAPLPGTWYPLSQSYFRI